MRDICWGKLLDAPHRQVSRHLVPRAPVQRSHRVNGTGLGLRRTHLGPLCDQIPAEITFFEVAPENWLGVGGRLGDAFERVTAQRPLVCHGLLLNLGGPDRLDLDFIARLKSFLDRRDAVIYGDHLSFCAADGQLYLLGENNVMQLRSEY